MTPAEKERAAVVAWLLKETEALVWLGQVQAIRHYARRIESGEHLKEGR